MISLPSLNKLQSFLPLGTALASLLLTGNFQLHAQLNLENSLSVRHCSFLDPEAGPYLESYINVHGKGIRYQELGYRQYKGEVAITLIVRQGDEVLDFRKYKLESSEVGDTTKIDFALMDQQRLVVKPGKIVVEFTAEDLNSSSNKLEFEQELNVSFGEGLSFSDVEFLDSYKKSHTGEGSFVKNGLEMVPYAMNFFPHERKKMTFYAELYGAATLAEDQFLLTASIRERDSERINSSFWQYVKAEKNAVVPCLMEFPLDELPTGNYNLVLEVRNKKNEVLHSKRTFVQRLNNNAVKSIENIAMLDVGSTWVDRYSHKQLSAYLQFLKPRADMSEERIITSIENMEDSTLKKRFLYNFWLKRDTVNPYESWLNYLVLVKKANDLYGTSARMGYRTDRGRVLLQYGMPNDIITRTNEPGAKPYEIWHFYTLQQANQLQQNNIRFVFYEPTLVSNEYKLLHSNAIGELQDPRWKLKIYEPTADPSLLNDFDQTNPRGHYGSQVGDFEDDFGGGSIFENDGP